MSSRRAHTLMALGVLVYLAGIVWDARRHATHPGVEKGLDMLFAHSGYVAGALVATFAAGTAALRLGTHTRWRYVIPFAGGVLTLVGLGWDAWAHAAGTDAAVAHSAGSIGFLLLAAGSGAAIVTGLRRRAV